MGILWAFTNGSVLQELGWEWSVFLVSHVFLVEGVVDLGQIGVGRRRLMKQNKKSPDFRSPEVGFCVGGCRVYLVKIMTVNRSI